MKIDVDVGPEFEKFVEEYQERKELETFDEAFGALALVGAKRVQALDKDQAKHAQALRYEAGELKTPPVYETRKNRHPKLVKAPAEPKPPKKPKGPKAEKPPKPAKVEKPVKAPKTSLSRKLVKPAKVEAPKPAKAPKVSKVEAPKAEVPKVEVPAAPAKPSTEDPLRVEEARAWVAEQRSKGAIVKPTDLVRNYGWAFNRAKAFLDETKAA